MSREVELDFRGVEPAQTGGPQFIHLPAGKYAIEVASVEESTAKGSGAEMFVAKIRIAQGEHAGKGPLTDYFSKKPNADGTTGFGMQRFMAFLLALGFPVTDKKVKLDLDRLERMQCIAELYDDELAGNERFDARTVSKIGSYYPLKAAAPKAAAPAPAPVAEAPVAAPTAAPVATPAEAPVAVAAAPAAAAAAADDVAQDIDALFD